jgi:hypothetical protein
VPSGPIWTSLMETFFPFCVEFWASAVSFPIKIRNFELFRCCGWAPRWTRWGLVRQHYFSKNTQSCHIQHKYWE